MVLAKSCQVYYIKYSKSEESLIEFLESLSKHEHNIGDHQLKIDYENDPDHIGGGIIIDEGDVNSPRLQYRFMLDKNALIVIGGTKPLRDKAAQWISQSINANKELPIPLAEMSASISRMICDKLIEDPINKIIYVDFKFTSARRFKDHTGRLFLRLAYSIDEDICIVVSNKMYFDQEYRHCLEVDGYFLFKALIIKFASIHDQNNVGHTLKIGKHYSFTINGIKLSMRDWGLFCREIIDSPLTTGISV